MHRQSTKLLLIEDHAMVRKGMKALISEFADISIVGEADNSDTALELAQRLAPDVLLLDLINQDVDEGLEKINKIKPDLPIIVLTTLFGDDQSIAAKQAGVITYIHKGLQSEVLIQTIRNAKS